MPKWLEGPILFLDIDGVMNSHDYVRRGGNLSCSRDGIDPEAVKHLQRIVDETGCSIVLSSTWRTIHPLAEMRGKLIAKGMRHPCPLRDKTPDLRREQRDELIDTVRGREIAAWIDRASFEGRYVCLDDDGDFLPGQPLVQTTFDMGLTEEHADRCIAILRGSHQQRDG